MTRTATYTFGPTTFICPGCGGACVTLRDLLTCCPRALRAVTNAVADKPGMFSLGDLLGGAIPPRVWQWAAAARKEGPSAHTA